MIMLLEIPTDPTTQLTALGGLGGIAWLLKVWLLDIKTNKLEQLSSKVREKHLKKQTKLLRKLLDLNMRQDNDNAVSHAKTQTLLQALIDQQNRNQQNKPV